FPAADAPMELSSTALISFSAGAALAAFRAASADSAGRDCGRSAPSMLKVYILPDAEMLAEEIPGGSSPYSPFDKWSSRMFHVLSAIFRGSKESVSLCAPPD